MKNSKTLFQEVVSGIRLREDAAEIRAMASVLLESICDVTKTDVLAGKAVPFPPEKAIALQRAVDRINQGEPVQYVVGEQYFYGRKFHVNPSVLIPRPETEELVRAVIAYHTASVLPHTNRLPLKILDIGTGSGCIPITLFHELGGADVYATDVSAAALAVAVGNAENHQARITFIENDILREKLVLSDFDAIVSNPPYVTAREKSTMAANVLDYEPHGALFVPNDDPLVFYRAIAAQAVEMLKPGGLVAVEINEKFGVEVSRLFIDTGLREASIVRDVAGKDRVVRAVKPY